MDAWLAQYGLAEFQRFFKQEDIDSSDLLSMLTEEERAACWRRGQLKLGHILKMNRILDPQKRHLIVPIPDEDKRGDAVLKFQQLMERFGLSLYTNAALGSGFDEHLLKDLNSEEIKLVITYLNMRSFGHIARLRQLLDELGGGVRASLLTQHSSPHAMNALNPSMSLLNQIPLSNSVSVGNTSPSGNISDFVSAPAPGTAFVNTSSLARDTLPSTNSPVATTSLAGGASTFTSVDSMANTAGATIPMIVATSFTYATAVSPLSSTTTAIVVNGDAVTDRSQVSSASLIEHETSTSVSSVLSSEANVPSDSTNEIPSVAKVSWTNEVASQESLPFVHEPVESSTPAVSIHVPIDQQPGDEKLELSAKLMTSDLMDLLKEHNLEQQQDSFLQAGINSVEILKQLGQECLSRLNLKLGPKVKLTKLLIAVAGTSKTPQSSSLEFQPQSSLAQSVTSQSQLAHLSFNQQPSASSPQPAFQSFGQPLFTQSQQPVFQTAFVQSQSVFPSTCVQAQPCFDSQATQQPQHDLSQHPSFQPQQVFTQRLSTHEADTCTYEEFAQLCAAETIEEVAGLNQVLTLHPEWANMPGEDGLAPLFDACIGEVVKALVNAKADPNPRDKKQCTPLMDVIRLTPQDDRDDNFFGLVGSLLSVNADPNIPCRHKKQQTTLLEISAIPEETRDLSVMELLLQSGARIPPDLVTKCQQASFFEGSALLQRYMIK